MNLCYERRGSRHGPKVSDELMQERSQFGLDSLCRRRIAGGVRPAVPRCSSSSLVEAPAADVGSVWQHVSVPQD